MNEARRCRQCGHTDGHYPLCPEAYKDLLLPMPMPNDSVSDIERMVASLREENKRLQRELKNAEEARASQQTTLADKHHNIIDTAVAAMLGGWAPDWSDLDNIAQRAKYLADKLYPLPKTED